MGSTAMAMTEKMRSWGQALRSVRMAEKIDVRKVANHCGVSDHVVREWEEDVVLPHRVALARLYGLIHRMRHFEGLLNGAVPAEVPSSKSGPTLKAPLSAVAKTVLVAVPAGATPPPEPVSEQKVAPVQVSEPKSGPLLAAPKTFGAALMDLRNRAGLKRNDLADLLKVHGSTIHSWETDKTVPVLEHYKKLLDLMPDLKGAPVPDSRETKVIPGKRPKGAPAEQAPVTKVAESPATTDAAELGKQYAEALRRSQAAKARAEHLEADAARAREEATQAANEAQEIHDQLLKAVAG